MGSGAPLHRLAEVVISINKRTYRFICSEGDAKRLDDVANYLLSKLDALIEEHGAVGDERLILMAALTVTDELFDARADVDDLLDGRVDELKSVASAAGDNVEAKGPATRLKAQG